MDGGLNKKEEEREGGDENTGKKKAVKPVESSRRREGGVPESRTKNMKGGKGVQKTREFAERKMNFIRNKEGERAQGGLLGKKKGVGPRRIERVPGKKSDKTGNNETGEEKKKNGLRPGHRPRKGQN